MELKIGGEGPGVKPGARCWLGLKFTRVNALNGRFS